MAINIQNIVTQLNSRLADSSANTTDLLRRVRLFQNLNNNGVTEYQYYNDLPTPIDSSMIGQLVYVRPTEDSFGTFFFGRAFLNDSADAYDALDSSTSGWQKIVLTANDSDNYADIDSSGPVAYAYQGRTAGFTSGGHTVSNIVQQFSFASDANATDAGDLSYVLQEHGGNSSTTHGYVTGGNAPGLSPGGSQSNWDTNSISKFAFSASISTTDVGDLQYAKNSTATAANETHGYDYGSASSTAPNNPTGAATPVVGDIIEKYSFTTDGNSTDVGDLLGNGYYSGAGHSSETHGHHAGGFPYANVIQKFPFAVDENSTDVGDLTFARNDTRGQSSTAHGYTSGGRRSPFSYPGEGHMNFIDKFPFATDANATDVGDMTAGRGEQATQSSTTNGYNSGGFDIGPPNITHNVIDKFPFATDANATDVGDLTVALRNLAGHHH